jgi:hypothetical protein
MSFGSEEWLSPDLPPCEQLILNTRSTDFYSENLLFASANAIIINRS